MKKISFILSTIILCWLSSATLRAESVQSPADDLLRQLYSLKGEYYNAETDQYEQRDDVPCYIVWQGDSVVWFDNLFPDVTFPGGDKVWVKGIVEYGIRITIRPQTVYRMTMDHEGMTMVHEFSVASLGTASDDQEYLDYQLVNNTRDHRLEPIQKTATFSLYDQNGTVYSQVKGLYIDEVGDALVTVPADADCKTFLMHYSNQASGQVQTSICRIATKDNKAWIQGLCRSIPDAWLVGNIGDFGTISLEIGQLLGAYGQEAILYFVGVRKAEGTISKLALAYQAQTGGYLISPEYMVAETTLGLNAYNAYGDVEILPAPTTADTPRSPWNLQVGGSLGEFQYIAFQYETTGQNDNWLVTDSLYYQVILDGEVLTFSPEYYESLTAPTDLIPCLYQDGTNFLQYAVSDMNSLPLFLIYRSATEWQTVGVKIVYCYFGQETCSEVVTLHNPDAGIDAHLTDADRFVNRYDLMGHTLSGITYKGLIIESYLCPDGTHRTTKKLYR